MDEVRTRPCGADATTLLPSKVVGGKLADPFTIFLRHILELDSTAYLRLGIPVCVHTSIHPYVRVMLCEMQMSSQLWLACLYKRLHLIVPVSIRARVHARMLARMRACMNAWHRWCARVEVFGVRGSGARPYGLALQPAMKIVTIDAKPAAKPTPTKP